MGSRAGHKGNDCAIRDDGSREPFKGMRYPESSLASRDGILILFGTYELEVHAIIEEIAQRKYEQIIDVGSAEGYYAVGLARRMKIPVVAFDCEPRERRYLRQLAALNNVGELITTRSWCDGQALSQLT